MIQRNTSDNGIQLGSTQEDEIMAQQESGESHLGGHKLKFALKDETVFKIVNRSVSSIAAEIGYHSSSQFSLDVLTDVCCHYLRRITSLLRIAHDTEDLRDSGNDFVDSLERVFHQINVPSAANLHQFICRIQAIKRHQLSSNQTLSQPKSSLDHDPSDQCTNAAAVVAAPPSCPVDGTGEKGRQK